VVIHEILAGSELARIESVKQSAESGRVRGEAATNILGIELLGHGTPHLHTLHSGQEALRGEINPIGLIELGTHQETQVFDLVVFAHQCGGEAQLAVRVHIDDYLLKPARKVLKMYYLLSKHRTIGIHTLE